MYTPKRVNNETNLVKTTKPTKKKHPGVQFEKGNVGKQLKFYRDDLVGISKQIKNTSKFVKSANKFLGGK